MLKKGIEVNWDGEPSVAFQSIKWAIKDVRVLKAPDYDNPMYIFSFASFHTVAVVLLQKKSKGFKQPITFFSKSLQAAELKYEINEKQAYALIKVVKDFRCYLMGETVVSYVPSVAVKDIFTQKEVLGRRCRWINKIQEFNIDVQITKLVRGQGLAKMMTQENLDANQINQVEEEQRSYTCDMDLCDWYVNIIYYLQKMKCRLRLNENAKRTLKLHAIKYATILNKIWWRTTNGILLKCVNKDQANKIFNYMHSEICGGHYMAKKIAQKVIREGFWQPSLFKDVVQIVKKCDAYQRFSSKLKFSGNLPLKPIEVQAPFQQWGIDFIGKITNKSSGGHSWILVATDYFTKWVEVFPTKKSTSRVVVDFILNKIIIRFGCPKRSVIDNAMCFRSNEYIDFCEKYGINRSNSSPYHPQGNGQVESSNKNLMKIVKRILDTNKRAWDANLPLAIWADKLVVKKSTGCAPFDLVYGIRARLPQNNLIGMYKFVQFYDGDVIDEMQARMNDILELDETRR